jgi:tRNA(Ile)-lysidine synthetase-like protein
LQLARTSKCDKSSGKNLELPGGWNLRLARKDRSREFHLVLETSDCCDDAAGQSQDHDYQYTLRVPGKVDVPELRIGIEAQVVDATIVPEAERAQLLDIGCLPKEILIRNWRPGDRYWPAHTAAAKKVKELLSDRHVTGTQKKLWPVAIAEDRGLIWMRGFAAPSAFRAPTGATKVVWIRELRS